MSLHAALPISIAWWSKSCSGSPSVQSAGEKGSPSSSTDKSSAAMRRQSVMKSVPVTVPPIVMDAATRSAILLTPLTKFQSIEYGAEAGFRSEEHTSELQSLMRISYAVFCLKKKKKTKNNHQ